MVALERAAAQAPGLVPTRFWLVRAYRAGGRVDRARTELETLRRLDSRAADEAAVR
jgi:hypothetical protein